MPIDDDSMRKIRRRQDAYNREIARIRGNANLSGQGKRQAMAAARQNAVTDIGQIKNAANVAYQQRRQQLERKLFDVSAEYADSVNASLSFRDAQQRVAGLKSGAEAQGLMAAALRSGDHLLQKALFSEAWARAGDRMTNSGWGEVARGYIQHARPDLAPVVDELSHLQEIDTRQRATAEAIETGVHLPPEMANMSPHDQQQAAAEAQQEAS